MADRLFNTDVTISGILFADSGTFDTSLTVSGVPVKLDDAGEPLALQFTLKNGVSDNYTLLQFAPLPFRVDSAVHQTTSGTVSGSLNINGSAVTGMSEMFLSVTEGTSSATGANTVAVGDKLTLTFSGTAGADMVSLAVLGTKL